MFEVRDGARTLQFSGRKLGFSSSWRQGSYRWIEFELYRTENGSYILSRIGVSLVYHSAVCSLVKRYGLQEAHTSDLEDDALPCDECSPTRQDPLVFPEKERHWAQVSEEPEAVLEALYKTDSSTGARYLTLVAKRLLEEASAHDPQIDSIYRVELIP